MVYIAAVGSVTDGKVAGEGCVSAIKTLADHKVEVRTLTIEPLSAGWYTMLEEDHFRCGNAPVEALELGCRLIGEGAERAVLISGEDMLRTGYAREERARLMDIYKGVSIPEAYDRLGVEFALSRGRTPEDLEVAAEALYENYRRTFGETAVDARWFDKITPCYRGVDCANPSVDFSGQLLLTDGKTLGLLDVPETDVMEVAGVATSILDVDGPEHVRLISRYHHLGEAVSKAEGQAGVGVADLFSSGRALLEVYTCYPVVPMAFLLESGIGKDWDDALTVIANRPVTVTGGMNLSKGAWNNPALNGLIAMTLKMRETSVSYGIVHGNGGLSFSQGVAVIKRV